MTDTPADSLVTCRLCNPTVQVPLADYPAHVQDVHDIDPATLVNEDGTPLFPPS